MHTAAERLANLKSLAPTPEILCILAPPALGFPAQICLKAQTCVLLLHPHHHRREVLSNLFNQQRLNKPYIDYPSWVALVTGPSSGHWLPL